MTVCEMGSALGRRKAAEKKDRKAKEARKAKLNSKVPQLFHHLFDLTVSLSLV